MPLSSEGQGAEAVQEPRNLTAPCGREKEQEPET